MCLLVRAVGNVICRRGLRTSFQEVRIPVPWGHVAGKWWGSKDRQPILAFHGWQDNAGTWDPFVSLLPEHLSVLAIDFPGSGLSSHLPPFQTYHFSDSVVLVERIRRYFQFTEKLSLIGHSGGSVVAFMYSSLFPGKVKHFFGVDYIIYAYTSHKERGERVGPVIDKAISLALRDPLKAKAYTWEEAAETWVKGTRGSVSRESAEILLVRGTKKTPEGKFIFSRDNRLKAQTTELITAEQAEHLASSVRCNVALVKGTRSHLFDQGLKHAPNLLSVLKKNAKSFELHEVYGGHHLHMDIPHIILPYYLALLEKKSP